MKYSKMIVGCVIALNVLFTVAILAVFWHTGNEPTILVTAWFAFTTGELWACASIRKKKLKDKEAEK